MGNILESIAEEFIKKRIEEGEFRKLMEESIDRILEKYTIRDLTKIKSDIAKLNKEEKK